MKRLTSLSARWNTGPISSPCCSTSLSDRTNCRTTGSSGPWGPCRCACSDSSPCSSRSSRAAPRCSSPRRCSRHFRACSPCSASGRGTRPRPWHWPCRISRVSAVAALRACSPPAIGDGSLYDDCSPIPRPTKASALSNCPDLRSPEARLRLPRLQQWRNSALRAAS